jgi:iron-sulfur cluster assembly protein
MKVLRDLFERRKYMLTVTEKTAAMIKGFLEKQEGPRAVRILSQPGCCGGSTLGLALDEQQENDVTFSDQGITFAVDKSLLKIAKPIRIDFVESPGGSGFRLTSSLPVTGGCC